MWGLVMCNSVQCKTYINNKAIHFYEKDCFLDDFLVSDDCRISLGCG